MMDHMLLTLGKYLRIIGGDAVWDPGQRTHELIARANGEGRVFVTCNRRPDEYPHPREALVLDSGDPVAQFRAVVQAFQLDTTSRLFTKCIRCNVLLDRIPDKETLRARVHPHVFERHQVFYACPSCGTVFWMGSHVRNTCHKLGLPLPAGCRE